MKIFIVDINGVPFTIAFNHGVIATSYNGAFSSIDVLSKMIPALRIQPRKCTEEFISAFAESFTETFRNYNEEVAEDVSNFITDALIAEIYA